MDQVLANVDQEPEQVKKCSRCRVKRTYESPEHLARYSTCANCRKKRKVVKVETDIPLPGMFTDWNAFLDRLKYNVEEDLHEVRYRGYTSVEDFPRPSNEEDIIPDVYQHYARMLTKLFIHPIIDITGYKFAVRDYHKGGRKSKKITFMFICSQDKGRQRKSRSNQERSVHNKLKTEMCESRLSLTYTLVDGVVNILYNHKSHIPYGAVKHTRPTSSRADVPSHLTHDIPPQLPPLQMPIQRQLDYNLASVAQFNTQVQQLSQMVSGASTSHLHNGAGHPSGDVFSTEPYEEKAAQALAAVAASAQQQQAQNKISVENIDKELIGLSE
ncbi:CYFA0S05e02608g1_1 [Cyberlindnera fabianii]|uniref:CYFA0S05e02608g1_1 n=1 Tax=Cyberlindnera fabianii TaxID=36022 RepID=A0A061AZ19_CYBFA|nr:hypothetical protein BON22_2159 [Cyberlindnera fabianii]CDR40629.1 CYFA0S05e02608g1_1 [Cyberlindnera fabianii]